MNNITVEEIFAELRQIEKKNTDGFSVKELALKLDMSEISVRKLINKSIENGKIEYVGDYQRPSIDKRMRRVPIYRLVKGRKK